MCFAHNSRPIQHQVLRLVPCHSTNKFGFLNKRCIHTSRSIRNFSILLFMSILVLVLIILFFTMSHLLAKIIVSKVVSYRNPALTPSSSSVCNLQTLINDNTDNQVLDYFKKKDGYNLLKLIEQNDDISFIPSGQIKTLENQKDGDSKRRINGISDELKESLLTSVTTTNRDKIEVPLLSDTNNNAFFSYQNNNDLMVPESLSSSSDSRLSNSPIVIDDVDVLDDVDGDVLNVDNCDSIGEDELDIHGSNNTPFYWYLSIKDIVTSGIDSEIVLIDG